SSAPGTTGVVQRAHGIRSLRIREPSSGAESRATRGSPQALRTSTWTGLKYLTGGPRSYEAGRGVTSKGSVPFVRRHLRPGFAGCRASTRRSPAPQPEQPSEPPPEHPPPAVLPRTAPLTRHSV